MKTRPPAKYQMVREGIMEAIRSGEFASEARLPSEQELALRFGVSYMTARRAVVEMVEADLLERHARRGTYIRAHSGKRLRSLTVNLICGSHDSSLTRAFLRFSSEAIARRGWQARVLRLHPGHERPAVRVLAAGEWALVMGEFVDLKGALGAALRKAADHAVVMSAPLSEIGVPSVLADDALAMRLAVRHLRAFGHRSIALVPGIPFVNPINPARIAALRALFAEENLSWTDEHNVVAVDVPRFGCRGEHTYEAVLRFLRRRETDATALICCDDEMALAALAACRDSGRAVPQQMSILNSGNSALLAFAQPSITCVDVNLRGHITRAMQMLEAAVAGELAPQKRLALIKPHLVERESVGQAPSLKREYSQAKN